MPQSPPSPLSPPFTIHPVRTPPDLTAVTALFETYASSLPISLSFQHFSTEKSTLPGKYAPPHGDLFLARSTHTSQPIGCVAFRPLPLPSPLSPPQSSDTTHCCEMKRLYVSPSARGLGLGKALVATVLRSAAESGYAEIRLDTLPSMRDAERLYRGVGFGDVGAYYDTPVEGTVFLGRGLREGEGEGS
jgi:ribosomal protein S18 acetylase RimI-like enzyme